VPAWPAAEHWLASLQSNDPAPEHPTGTARPSKIPPPLASGSQRATPGSRTDPAAITTHVEHAAAPWETQPWCDHDVVGLVAVDAGGIADLAIRSEGEVSSSKRVALTRGRPRGIGERSTDG
jgi:hypothetical protein